MALCAAVPHRYGHPLKCDSCQRTVTLNLTPDISYLITLLASSNSFGGSFLTMFSLSNNSSQESTAGTPCQNVKLKSVTREVVVQGCSLLHRFV